MAQLCISHMRSMCFLFNVFFNVFSQFFMNNHYFEFVCACLTSHLPSRKWFSILLASWSLMGGCCFIRWHFSNCFSRFAVNVSTSRPNSRLPPGDLSRCSSRRWHSSWGCVLSEQLACWDLCHIRFPMCSLFSSRRCLKHLEWKDKGFHRAWFGDIPFYRETFEKYIDIPFCSSFMWIWHVGSSLDMFDPWVSPVFFACIPSDLDSWGFAC